MSSPLFSHATLAGFAIPLKSHHNFGSNKRAMSNTIKLHNVLAFNTAISDGYHPRDYTYHKDDIPTGEYRIILDFMIWANKVSGIDQFCTVRQNGQKIRLTVFRDKEENYHLHDVDGLQLEYNSSLTMQVELNGRDKPTLHSITVLSDISGEQSNRRYRVFKLFYTRFKAIRYLCGECS